MLIKHPSQAIGMTLQNPQNKAPSSEHPYNVAVLLAPIVGAGKVLSARTEQLGLCKFAVLRKFPCRRESYKVSYISG